MKKGIVICVKSAQSDNIRYGITKNNYNQQLNIIQRERKVIKQLQNMKYTTMMFVVVFFISLLTVAILTFSSIKAAKSGLHDLGEDAMHDIHSSVINSLTALNDQIKHKLKSDLTNLEFQMMRGEDLYIGDETSKIGNFNVPVMKKGDSDVYANTELVDLITRETGAKTTIFQLVDNKLLRISTSVIKKNGERAIGTYITADSPVYKTIMRGDTFLGKAFVVDDWYLTAYSPLYDMNKKIIGAVFVGDLMLNKEVVGFISKTKIGHGYFYVYGPKGEFLVHPTHDSSESVFDVVPEFRNHKSGFLNYESSKGVKKIVYAEMFDAWGLWIAVGMNDDDITKGVDRKLLNQALVLGAIVMGLGMFLNFFLIRIVNTRVKSIADVAALVGAGDYTVKFNVKSKDVLGDLSNSLNDMVDSSSEMLGQINKSSASLATASTQLAGIANELVTSADETTSIAEQSFSNAEEVSANMDSVAAASEESATNLNMVAAATEEMGNTIQEIAENSSKASVTTNEAVSATQRSQEAVESLGSAADSIGKITETITEISEQTNLLALNATIEAARAGEAGKGFAVVANEIKELAKETANATGSIREAITEIQSRTNSTITDIGGISGVISDVNDIVQTIVTAVEEQSITTNEIVQNVTQASAGISEINENIATSSMMTSEVSSGVGQVRERSVGAKSSIEHLQASASELSNLADDLSSLVARFKV